MFKAVDRLTGEEVIILDLTPEALKEVRRQTQEAKWRCPECNQHLIVKLPKAKRRHFAHKHRGDCPSASESGEHLQARARLYTWLKTKFASGVTIEKRLDGISLPHPIDCWVDDTHGHRIAYWIFETSRAPAYREKLREAQLHSSAEWNIFFLSSLMQRNGKPRNILNLTTSEREFLKRSEYDLPYEHEQGRGAGKSLHYLDGENGTLITFRAMGCTEFPQEYTGVEISSPFHVVKVRPQTGECVHPGEHETLQKYKESQAKEEERRKQAEETWRRNQEARQAAECERQAAYDAMLAQLAQERVSSGKPPVDPELSSVSTVQQPEPRYEDQEGICVFCGHKTRRWWTYNGADGTCKCNDCRDKQRAQPTSS